ISSALASFGVLHARLLQNFCKRSLSTGWLSDTARYCNSKFVRRTPTTSRSIWSQSPRDPLKSMELEANTSAEGRLLHFDATARKWIPSMAHVPGQTVAESPPRLSLLSWNIDFAGSLLITRFKAALDHLESLLSQPSAQPTVILLQEVDQDCFAPLLAHDFIRTRYHVTNDASPQSYSTLTLVPNPLAAYVSAVTRVPFARGSETRMSRDCLYVDLDLHLPHAEEPSALFRLRIANTHLESLRGFGDAARPKQLAKIAKLLTAPGIDGGVVAGDMNCIAPTDQDLAEKVGLADAWVKKEGDESNAEGDDTGEADGHTWGYQPKNRFPPRRMDKVLFAGNVSATIVQRVGVGLRVERYKNPVWVSDHYGLLASLAFSRPAIES
ncbi:unnamed protein product, partial [Mycena citricolor]